jgi:hypothetical protein
MSDDGYYEMPGAEEENKKNIIKDFHDSKIGT